MCRVVRADDDAALAGIAFARRKFARMALLATKALGPRELRDFGHARHARRQHQMLRAQRNAFTSAIDDDDPFLAGLVELGALAFRRCPAIQLHHPGVHFQPVAELVLGREDRPVVRERQVRHVVVPDGIVQAERLVAVAPAVAGTRVLLEDDGRHVETPEPRAQRQPALAAADDQAIRLLRVAERRFFRLSTLEPGLAISVDAVLHALVARAAAFLLETLQLLSSREDRPGAVVFQAQNASALGHLRLEGEARLGDAVRVACLALQAKVARLDAGQRCRKEVSDLRPSPPWS